MAVTASLVVTFGQAAQDDALLIAEVDARSVAEGGTNNGRTQFLPGDSVNYLVYRHKVQSTEHRASAGSVSRIGSGQHQVEETITFLDVVDGNVRYPVYTLDSFEWLGNDLGQIAAAGGQAIRATTPGVGVAIVRYTTKFDIWRLNSPAQINGRDSFDIAVLITGE